MTDLTAPHFQDADAAREYLEGIRWPDGPFCPHCGSTKPPMQLKGKSTRPGLYKCAETKCRKQFTVTVGTVFERSRVPLNKWLLAVHLMCASKKGISAHQLHRTLGVTYKTAWFMAHRIREAMREPAGILGGGGGTVEADETYWGKKQGATVKRGYGHKMAVFSLVERGGRVQSIHMDRVTSATLRPILDDQIAQDARLLTDDAGQYQPMRKMGFNHDSVNHSVGEYVRGDIHTNTVENYYSILKRGLVGTYQHVSEGHLKRYVCEFDFRYNYRASLGFEDGDRADACLKGIAGKRLTYRRTNQPAH